MPCSSWSTLTSGENGAEEELQHIVGIGESHGACLGDERGGGGGGGLIGSRRKVENWYMSADVSATAQDVGSLVVDARAHDASNLNQPSRFNAAGAVWKSSAAVAVRSPLVRCNSRALGSSTESRALVMVTMLSWWW